MIGRQLPFFSVLVPFWLIWAFAGLQGHVGDLARHPRDRRELRRPQYLVSNYHGPARGRHRRHRVDGLAGLFLKVWKPKKIWTSTSLKGHENDTSEVSDLASEKPVGHEADAGAAIFAKNDRRAVMLAWAPWAILSVFVFVWGIPAFKKAMDGISVVKIPFDGLHNMIEKVPPVVAVATRKRRSSTSTTCRPPAPGSCWLPSSPACSCAIRCSIWRGSTCARSTACASRC
jgi:lactate permease